MSSNLIQFNLLIILFQFISLSVEWPTCWRIDLIPQPCEHDSGVLFIKGFIIMNLNLPDVEITIWAQTPWYHRVSNYLHVLNPFSGIGQDGAA